MPRNPIGYALRNRRAGQHTLVWARPELQAPESFELTSPAFDHRASMPARFKGRVFATNNSPALAWTAPPVGTAELLLIVEDPDAPRSTPALHALAAGIGSDLRELPENGLVNPSPVSGLRHGRGALGRLGWSGPMPPPSHGPHTYVFQLFALDTHPELPDRFTLEQALGAASGHVIARARLDGTYENP
jgi:Raf kinase inhibitor-like YbhB/YbcL family protein